MKLKTNLLHRHKLPMGVLGLDIAADDALAYAACMDGIYRVEVASGEYERVGGGHESYVSGAVLLPQFDRLVTAGYDGQVIWHDVNSFEQLQRQLAHDFWSWDLQGSPDGRRIASVTGQYLAGGYKYEPADSDQPCVKIFDAADGNELFAFEHVPSVQAVAISPDSQYVAAGNLMGEVRVWDINTGEQSAAWTTSDFTSWGIIKSHCYIGGIFALAFTPDGEHLLAAGMGPMRDPMAGNGRQLWQRFAWRESPPEKVDETLEEDSGEGLMETLAVHPDGEYFVMAGRLRGGAWNAGFFDLESGRLIHSVKTECRITKAVFSTDGQRLYLAGTQGQPGPKDGGFPSFGRLDVFELET